MSAQRYADPTAQSLMRLGLCPECGLGVDQHTGWGNSGCSLTDNGVAQRIVEFRASVAVPVDDPEGEKP